MFRKELTFCMFCFREMEETLFALKELEKDKESLSNTSIEYQDTLQVRYPNILELRSMCLASSCIQVP